jgi:hypothetical protein
MMAWPYNGVRPSSFLGAVVEFEYPFYATSTLLPEGLSTDDYRHEFYRNNRYMGIEQEYQVGGGTAGTQPTFTGDPLFSGHYVILGSTIFFDIQVDFDNITSFGTGQYYLTLPFASKYGVMFRGGCLHDISTSRDYHISGHVFAGSDEMQLFTTDRSGNRIYDFAFEQGEPITLTTADNFHISGTYIVDDTP